MRYTNSVLVPLTSVGIISLSTDGSAYRPFDSTDPAVAKEGERPSVCSAQGKTNNVGW
jgi:hypothetical protein